MKSLLFALFIVTMFIVSLFINALMAVVLPVPLDFVVAMLLTCVTTFFAFNLFLDRVLDRK